MSRPQRPSILVTGCSSGIGLELAQLLVKRQSDFNICLTARASSVERIHKAGIKDAESIIIRPMDVTMDSERRAVVEEMGWRWGGTDILVNNAGVSYRAVVEHMSEEEEYHQMATNFFGPIALIRLVLPHMRNKNWGRLINISSVSGMMAMPTMSSYSASKFALEGACEALWYELKPWNIQVSVLQPGFLRSDSFKNVVYSRRAGACDLQNDEYCAYYNAMAPFVEKLMSRSFTTSTDVARRALRIIDCKSPSLRIPATLDAQVFYWLRRILPRRIYHAVLFFLLPKDLRRIAKVTRERAKKEET